MTDSDRGSIARVRPLCRHCQDVIGAYEPLVLETDDGLA